MFAQRFRWLLMSHPRTNKSATARPRRKSAPKPYLHNYFGKESELKGKIRRYVPSQGWTSAKYLFKNLAPSLSNILVESTLKELLAELRGCRFENDRACRTKWLDSSPADANMTNDGMIRSFQNDLELCEAVQDYIPCQFVPLREVALQTPIDVFTALRESRFLFLLRFPEKFTVAHCIDDNTIVVKNLQSNNFDPCYRRYRSYSDAILAAALCIPCKDAISEKDCLYRIPRFYRIIIRNMGYSFSTLAGLYPDLFVVESDDELSFSNGIRSKVSDPEKSHPDNPPLSTKAVVRLLQRNYRRLEALTESRNTEIFREIKTEDEFLQTALDIQNGKAALRFSRRIGTVRDELIQNEILSCLPQDPAESLEYDEVLLNLTPKVRRQLAYQEGGFRKFVADRNSLFIVVEESNSTRIARANPPTIEVTKKELTAADTPTTEKQSGATEDHATRHSLGDGFHDKEGPLTEDGESYTPTISTKDEDNSLSFSADEDDVLSLENIQNMKVPEKKTLEEDVVEEYEELEGNDDDYLASEVARFVPAEGISGIAVRDLALQIGKEMRRKIREEGFKTFNEFIEAYPEWFIVHEQADGVFINLKPAEEELDAEKIEMSESSNVSTLSASVMGGSTSHAVVQPPTIK
ncbi:Tetratricopeptide repeat-containing protein [Perkinsela sp. CCAP 1560/4]|nr:Tetratricopeptide repeat-containing protein [Perkinsela sp. CCAP 1560/4]|eukprot:KNH05188.1 Tetratricopeptide repeat-containing protein [Perkinsela sp. CCAP 1560/4]